MSVLRRGRGSRGSREEYGRSQGPRAADPMGSQPNYTGITGFKLSSRPLPLGQGSRRCFLTEGCCAVLGALPGMGLPDSALEDERWGPGTQSVCGRPGRCRPRPFFPDSLWPSGIWLPSPGFSQGCPRSWGDGFSQWPALGHLQSSCQVKGEFEIWAPQWVGWRTAG